MGAIKGDTRSLEYSTYVQVWFGRKLAISMPPNNKPISGLDFRQHFIPDMFLNI